MGLISYADDLIVSSEVDEADRDLGRDDWGTG